MTEMEVTVETAGKMAARNVIRDDARLLDDVALVLPTAAIGRGTISIPRNPQAGELLPGGRLVVNFHVDPGWDHSRLFLWPIDATTWIVFTPDGDKHAERSADYSRMRVRPLGGGEMPEVGSVELCLITCLHLSGTYDQLNSPRLASMETVARRIALWPQREADHVGPEFITTKGEQVP